MTTIPELTNPTSLTGDRPPENLIQVILRFVNRSGRLGHILIVLLLICAGLAFVWSQIPEQGKLNIINRIIYGPPLITGLYPGVEIDESKLTYDFREWTSPPAGDASQACKVTTNEELLVRRVRSEATYLARRAGTSGAKPDFTSSTHHVSYQETKSERVGGAHMTHYEVLLDISKEPVNVPFEAQLRSVRYGSFRDVHHEWASAAVFQPTRALTIELQFSDTKPARNFTFGSSPEIDGGNNSPVYPTVGQSLSPEPGQYEITGNTIRWRVQYPKVGYCYRIDWDW